MIAKGERGAGRKAKAPVYALGQHSAGNGRPVCNEDIPASRLPGGYGCGKPRGARARGNPETLDAADEHHHRADAEDQHRQKVLFHALKNQS